MVTTEWLCKTMFYIRIEELTINILIDTSSLSEL